MEQQTATAEVLQVINSSPGDLAPVFDAMLEKAMRLCEAAFGMLMTFDGARFEVAGHRGLPARYAEYLATTSAQPGAGGGQARVLRGEKIVHFADMKEEEAYRDGTNPNHRAMVDLGGARTGLVVPLREEEAVVGTFTIYRQEVRPFSDKQIALLQNFAAQAVIAIENARLLTETREALEQQTATAEVLQVINSSPGDLAPVFDAILEKAHALCGASFGALMTYDGAQFQPVALQRVPTPFRGIIEKGIRPTPGDPFDRIVEGASLSHIHDLAQVAAEHPNDALPKAAVDLGGIRTLLVVPLHKDNALLGVVTAYRQEVRPFSDKQIALLQNFAAQAVIAIENARLLTETREALEQQTATAEVLQVINSSPGDLAPVFEAILDKAHTLCGATLGSLFLFDGELFRAAATYGYPEDLARRLRQGVVLSATTQLLNGVRWVHNPDLTLIDSPTARAVSGRGGVRTNLMLPLRKDGRLLGAISCNRREIRPFTEKEIALLENFAAQAVIAMENARLLGELRQRTGDLQESLEYQTATSDVLKVISRSGADLGPVLDTLVETAARICRADSGFIFEQDDGRGRMVASFGIPAEYRAFQTRNPIAPGRGTLAGRTMLERRAVHIEDAAEDPEYTRVEAVQLGRQRTMLGVPLIREDALIGVITLARSRVEPFAEKQIELVRTFADQAVIAIENARLLGELRQRTGDLQEVARIPDRDERRAQGHQRLCL